MANVYEEIEHSIWLIGSTAIEDRLQDEVDKTIQFAKNAGIKVWVLTGDKIGTAINIGLSAGLLDNDKKMTQHIIREATDYDKLSAELSEIKSKMTTDEMKYLNE